MYNKLLGNIPLFLLTNTYKAWLSPHLCPTITLLIIYLCFWQRKLKPSFCVILPSFSPLTWTCSIMIVGKQGWCQLFCELFSTFLSISPGVLPIIAYFIWLMKDGNWHDKINELYKGFNFESLKLTLVLLRWISEQHGDIQGSASATLV